MQKRKKAKKKKPNNFQKTFLQKIMFIQGRSVDPQTQLPLQIIKFEKKTCLSYTQIKSALYYREQFYRRNIM